MKTYTKENNELKVTETKEEVKTYTLEYLQSQKEWFENEIVKNQAEIARIEALLVEADKAGVTARVVEPTPVEEGI